MHDNIKAGFINLYSIMFINIKPYQAITNNFKKCFQWKYLLPCLLTEEDFKKIGLESQ